MLAPLLGAVLLTVLSVALVVSWRRSRDLVRATHALREGHARRLLEERLLQEKMLVEHERAAFLADVSKVVADSLDAPVAVATVARLVVPFLGDACVIDLTDDEGGLVRAAVVHRDPGAAAALEPRYSAQRPTHPLLARVLREGRPLAGSHELDVDVLLLPLLARGRTLGVVSLFSFDAGRRFGPDERALAEDLARRIALGVDNARLYRSAVDSHRRFHDLVEGLGAIVWEADAVRRHYTFVSGRAVTLLGHPLGRWHDDPDFWLALQHPDDRDRTAAESRAARAEARDHDLEYRVLAADGRLLWILDLVRVVRHPDGTVRHLRGVMVDVTEGRTASVLASVAALANAAAHEINNPLAVIMGNLEAVARRADTPPAMALRTEAMLAAGRRIAAIVGSMRRITRLENLPAPDDLPAMLDLRRSSTADNA